MEATFVYVLIQKTYNHIDDIEESAVIGVFTDEKDCQRIEEKYPYAWLVIEPFPLNVLSEKP